MNLQGWITPEQLEGAVGKKEIDFNSANQYDKEKDLTEKQAHLIVNLMKRKRFKKLTDINKEFIPKSSTGFISIGMAAKVINELFKR